jgi:hypothetical protein
MSSVAIALVLGGLLTLVYLARSALRSASGRRALAAYLTLVASVGTGLAFLAVALILATFNCEDGCAVGSRWAPGAWGSVVELWLLAVPAVLLACGLVFAVSTGRRRASWLSWLLMTGLLIGWCVFTGASSVSIDFSGSNSHWMWLAGLLVACGGGLAGVAVSQAGPRSGRPTAASS